MTNAINHLVIEDRNNEIRAARKTGRTMADIGRQFGITKQRVQDILKKDTAYPFKTGAEVERELGLGHKAGPVTLYSVEEIEKLRAWCDAHKVCPCCGGPKKMLSARCWKCGWKYKNRTPEQKKKHYEIVKRYRAKKRGVKDAKKQD